MNITTTAIICSVQLHGERGSIVKALTPDAGLVVGYVRSGQSKSQRPVLMPGNSVAIRWSARTEDQLGTMHVELIKSQAHVMLGSQTKALALAWLCALTATVLPERMDFSSIYTALSAWLDVLDCAEVERTWAEALIGYELHLLAALGFGLDLSCCAATGATEALVYVSPKSGRAVSRDAGEAYADKLLPLPTFILDSSLTPTRVNDTLAALVDGFHLSGYFLERHVLTDISKRILASRIRLVDALMKAS